MLYSLARGRRSAGQPLLHAEAFSPNTSEGACLRCHGLGRIYMVTGPTGLRDHRTDFTR
jgi:excinuclease ABC subunit A